MSRIAKLPINIPPNVGVEINGQKITIKGDNGELTHTINNAVSIQKIDDQLTFVPRHNYTHGWALAGTTRAILNSMVIGVTQGFTKKLQLIGVGYRITLNNHVISLFLGYSHTINYKLPMNITAECPSPTEIILKSADKQALGQVAIDLHSYRHPDPYKGKGIRYAEEIVYTKEAKKK
ncbi:50S ribosomal protein L6 [Candidatus Palibaumannia cicadellinicola]|uniref:50S ribosomal protein L6 n=1 Tax=Baumannia cicadellinicola subsp. Homalodisca coagulata TaxID=374463 RepID=Q1LTC3_BAUCH|nr:50S ribosomal protein L6 [Candidatus Baumannia cicadellinicola]ABF14090.1 50S ribosomal subunit protein L6 [Baumannia cicadellinicola str. Hc (Homalodisca coagulata)]MCJ7462227.1 50S ribosomal protein L6 [Candidatus Baumannia cicadellinicola]MCJ7462745.1 50S ribosomal protein L6 [Candidatus Baumannia cicadellinicola]